MRFILTTATLLAVVACGSATESPTASPLAGLSEVAARDSAGNPIPSSSSNTSPGIVRGTV